MTKWHKKKRKREYTCYLSMNDTQFHDGFSIIKLEDVLKSSDDPTEHPHHSYYWYEGYGFHVNESKTRILLVENKKGFVIAKGDGVSVENIKISAREYIALKRGKSVRRKR